MKYSVIIPTLDNLALLDQCLKSVYAHTKEADIIVVDGSKDGSSFSLCRTINTNFNHIEHVAYPKSKGFSDSINKGIESATGDFIIWLNDDTIVPAGWAERLWAALESAPFRLGLNGQLGAIGPVSNYAAGDQGVDVRSFNPSDPLSPDQFYKEKFKENVLLTHSLSGFCLMHRRAAIQDIGILNSDFCPGGFEDNDFCLRLEKIGQRVAIALDVFVYHKGSQTLNRPEFHHMRHGMANQLKFYQKWPRPKKQRLVTSYTCKNPDDYFYESLFKSIEFSDSVCVTFDNDPLINQKAGLLLNPKVHVFNITHEANETERRNIATNNALNLNPDWILSLDSDEVMEPKCTYEFMHRLLNHPNPHVKYIGFSFLNFWDDEAHWRTDGIFGRMAGPRLFKVEPNQVLYSPHPLGFHVSHTPHPVSGSTRYCSARILHYGYVAEDQREKKYEFYSETDTSKDSFGIGAEDYTHIISKTVLRTRWCGSQTISLNMIYGGETIEILSALDSLSLCADNIEIMATVDHATAKEIGKLFGAGIWYSSFKGDFSKMRNFLKSNSPGDWILYFDPDESVPAEFTANLPKLIEDQVDAFLFSVINLHRNGAPSMSDTVRLFRNIPEMIFRGFVHENLDESLKDPQFKVAECPWKITHYGYLNPDKDPKKKTELYKSLTLKSIKDNPKDPLAHFNLGLTYQEEGDFEKALSCYTEAIMLNKQYYHPQLQVALIRLIQSRSFFASVLSILPPTHRLSEQLKQTLETLNSIITPEIKGV